MPAIGAFLVSMAFTLTAVYDRGLATEVAPPAAVIAIGLMVAQARRSGR
jgi:hypothetical protein